MRTCSRLSVLLFSIWLLGYGCGAPADIGIASAAGKKFHDRFNQQDYAGIYADADPKFQQSVTSDKLTALLTRVHDKLGTVTDTTRVGFNVNYNVSGSTVTLTYNTKFQQGDAQEQFVWLKSGDTVRLLHYNVQGSALDESNVQ